VLLASSIGATGDPPPRGASPNGPAARTAPVGPAFEPQSGTAGPANPMEHPSQAPAQEAGPSQQQPAPPTPAPGQPTPAPAPPFAEWLEGVRAEALERGIKAETVRQAFENLQPLPVVVERDRMQAEFTLSLDEYLTRRLTKALVRDTRAALARHRRLLTRVDTKYGVPAHVLASVWAIESNLGRFSGVRPTIQALATLAWEGRRATFFRSELLDALAILDAGDVEPARLRGSWAGALGQPQFMPSTYLRYAQDFDGDGRRDIWGSLPDVFASIANFLKENGWTAGEGWGREVRVTAAGDGIAAAAPLRLAGCRAFREMSEPLPLARWSELGVRTSSGEALPPADRIASLVAAGPRSFLVYGNYEALLAYNCAHAYALSVGVLADRVRQ
jgi:membrane-bound lytic murein transglycosylase B